MKDKSRVIIHTSISDSVEPGKRVLHCNLDYNSGMPESSTGWEWDTPENVQKRSGGKRRWNEIID